MSDTANPSHTAIRIIISDGSPNAIAAFKIAFALDTNPEIIGAASTSKELLNILLETPCDALLLDHGTLGSLSVLQSIKASYPSLYIIYLVKSPISIEV